MSAEPKTGMNRRLAWWLTEIVWAACGMIVSALLFGVIVMAILN